MSENVSMAETMAKVTGSVGATYTTEHRDAETEELVTDSSQSYVRKVEITIGWTISDMDNGYSSFAGYKPGAEQHTETVQVTIPEDLREKDPAWFALHLAEAAFEATNAPHDVQGMAGQIRRILGERGFNGSHYVNGEQVGHYSLSTGDTVTVAEVMLECASFGWERVYPEVQV